MCERGNFLAAPTKNQCLGNSELFKMRALKDPGSGMEHLISTRECYMLLIMSIVSVEERACGQAY